MKQEKSYKKKGNTTPKYKNIILRMILMKVSDMISLKKEKGKDSILQMI